VVRAYYRRQLWPKLEEIYKYSNYLHSVYTQRRQKERLKRIVLYYEMNKDLDSFSIDEEVIADINQTHRYLISKLPNLEFLNYVKDILSLRDWLKETGDLSGQEVGLLENSLDGFWPQAKGNSAQIQQMLENRSAWIKDFHEKHVKPVLDFLNVRLWRWKGRRLKNEKDYLRLLQRSAGWFSALGVADWLKNTNYGREQNSAAPVRILDYDSFFSGTHRSIIKKEGEIPANVQIIDLVTDKLGKRFGKKQRKVKISTSNHWPFRAEGVDFITSIFSLHELTSAELFTVFEQASYTLKPGGNFVITVPFDQYIPPEGIKVLARMGLKLSFESVSCQAIKNMTKLSQKENRDAISESISKRKFYLLVLEKQKVVEEPDLTDITEVDKKNLRFIEAPRTDADDKIEKRMRLNRSHEINLNDLPGNIEDVEAANLRLTSLYHRLPAELDFDEDTFRVMIKNIIDYQYVLYEYFADLDMEENFDILDTLVEDYKDIVGSDESSLKDLTVSDRENILTFHAYLEAIFIVLKDTPNFSKTLKSVFAFKENNRDFLEAKDIALIEDAEKIWNSQIIQGKNINFEKIKDVFYKMIELDKKIAGIEAELVILLQRWGADEKIKDRVKGKSFWPLIKSQAGWQALEYFTKAYSNGLKAASRIYVCNANSLLKKIIEKTMEEKKLKVNIDNFPRQKEQVAKLEGRVYYVLSIFDFAENDDGSLLEPQFSNIRDGLHENGRFIIILAKTQENNGLKQSLKDSGFNIRTTYRQATGFNLIETDKGGETEESLTKFNKLKGKSSFTSEDEETLRQFWRTIFQRKGTVLTTEFKRTLRTYITALPVEVNFRIMLEQLELELWLGAEDFTKKDFVPLRRMEKFLDELISKTPALECSLYDRINEEDGRLIEGLLMRTTPEGKRVNWLLKFEEDRFYGQLRKLSNKIEKFQVSDEGVSKGFENDSKNHEKKIVFRTKGDIFNLSQHLDQINKLHSGILDDAADVKKVKVEIETKIEAWFLCDEKELPSKYRDIMNYVWHGDALLKLTIFSIVMDIWKMQIEVDSEIEKRLKKFAEFMGEYEQVSWEVMDQNINEVLRVLFVLSSWLDYEQKNDLLNLFIRFRIDKFAKEIEKEAEREMETGHHNVISLSFELPHTKNVNKQKIMFSLLGDNEPDKIYFQNRLIKAFNLSTQVFTFESSYNLQYMMNFNKHEREIYLELLGRITEYLRQNPRNSSGRKKAAILDKYINIFVRDARGKAMLVKGKKNPLSEKEVAEAIDYEEDRLDFVGAMKNAEFNLALELNDLISTVKTESSLVTLDLLNHMISLLDKTIGLEDKIKIENNIKKAIDNINSNFVLVSLMIDAEKSYSIRSYIAARIIPDKNFRIVLDMICGEGDCTALLIEKNLEARKAIIDMLNNGHNEEVIPAVAVIRSYLLYRESEDSLKFLREIWETFLDEHGRMFQLDGKIRYQLLLEDLSEAALRKIPKIISDVYKEQKDKYTPQTAFAVLTDINKILDRIETLITLLSQEDELEDLLLELAITKEAASIDSSI